MNKINISDFLKVGKNTVKRYAPEILTGLGITGMITTTIFAVKATPKALMLIEEKKLDLDKDELTPVEVVKTVWPCYVSPLAMGAVSVFCLISANSVHTRRNAAIVTAYTLSETALKDYRAKVIEAFGEKKEETVRDAVAKEKVEQNPVTKNEIVITNNGETLCYEPLSGRYFKSDIDIIKKAINDVNHYLLFNSYISLNDFYERIGLGFTAIGERLGWNVEQGLVEIRFSSQLTDDGTPCLVFDFLKAPTYDYDRFL